MLITVDSGFRRPAGPCAAPASGQDSRLDASAIWSSLLAGRLRIRTSYCSALYCHLELEQASVDSRVVPSSRDAATLERVLLGEYQKVLALDWGCSASTVTSRAARCSQALGLQCTAKGLPTALIILVQAARQLLPSVDGTITGSFGTMNRQLVSVRRPNTQVAEFSIAERECVELLIDGCSRKEMARLRGTSVRTIANQLGQVYRKCGVSSRIPLLARLVRINSQIETAATEAANFSERLVPAPPSLLRGRAGIPAKSTTRTLRAASDAHGSQSRGEIPWVQDTD